MMTGHGVATQLLTYNFDAKRSQGARKDTIGTCDVASQHA
jgi:hypothetical protein